MAEGIRRIFAGHRIRALRQRLGLSQRALATQLSVSVSYLSQIENGDRPITPLVMVALARAFPADWETIAAADEGMLLVDAIEASSDPSVPDARIDEATLRRGARQQPRRHPFCSPAR